jgi:hypothetical protein
MSNRLQLKLGATSLLLLAAPVGQVADGFTVAWLIFGLVNVWLTIRGTQTVRVASLVVSLAALAAPGGRTVAAIAAWLVWPPALLVAWALARERAEVDVSAAARTATPARLTTAAIIAAVAIASATHRMTLWQHLDQTAALFIGIPALLAIVVVMVVSPHSATGVACKAVTVGLLVSLIFLGEGVLCVLMSAPLFYVIAIAVGFVADRNRRRAASTSVTLQCIAILAVPLSLEGVTGATTIDRDSAVSVTRLVAAPAHEVARALLEPPRFDRRLPAFLRAGFPRPEAVRIDRTPRGDRWIIRMRGGEMRLNGMEPRAGDLVMELDEATPGLVRWRAISDSSHITHFLRWRESTVRFEPAGDGATRVTWTIRYSRDLDPSWYFGWWERYAASQAAGYLIEAVATP